MTIIVLLFFIVVMHPIPPFSSVLVATLMTPTASMTPTSGEATKIDCYYISSMFAYYVTFFMTLNLLRSKFKKIILNIAVITSIKPLQLQLNG